MEAPLCARAWAGARATTSPGPACPQKLDPGGTPNLGGYAGPTSEDCLTLDVTAPGRAHAAPVMVWIFGGGNLAGGTNLPSYDAVNFARDGVIVVAMNYRLGALGFFAHPALTAEAPGRQPLVNYGLMDQIAALKWVKRNIAAFGGNPANVTIFGESAGGSDVLDLLAIPSATGLFRRAIVQSGGGWDEVAGLAQREAQGAALATRLSLPGAAATPSRLRALKADAVVAAQDRAGGVAVDGRLMTETATQAFARGHQNPIPLIIGSNSNEASLMRSLGMSGDPADPLWRSLFNDRTMAGPARWIAAQASRRAPAWLYYFSYVPERQRSIRPGTNHASEIPFVFDSLDAIPGRSALVTPSERAAATLAHSCWVGFARSGKPNCAGGQAWPGYSPNTGELIEFGDPPGLRSNFRQPQLDAQEKAVSALLVGN
jgi:para-nitrobenzyl esterase